MYLDPGPVLYRAHECYTLRFAAVAPYRIASGAEYTAKAYAFGGLHMSGGETVSEEDIRAFSGEPLAMERDGNAVTLKLRFPQEDRYMIDIYDDGVLVERHDLYALESDLFASTPYKGDNHIHTRSSDGTESPAYMAAMGRRMGYDYILITDHYAYEPSLEAARELAPLGLEYLVVPGEEVHAPGAVTHIINWGGSEGITQWFKGDPAEYEARVAANLEKVTVPMLPENRTACAATQTVFDRIHEVGGLAVFCHPGWIIGTGLQLPEDCSNWICQNGHFDALELVAGGAYELGNQLQAAWYKDKPAMPILGSADAHRAFTVSDKERLGMGKHTIVFARELTVESLKEAILAGLTVACDGVKCTGPYRLVKYAHFLREAVFPKHDDLARRQGTVMLRYVCGKDLSEADYGQGPDSVRGSVTAYYDTLHARD